MRAALQGRRWRAAVAAVIAAAALAALAASVEGRSVLAPLRSPVDAAQPAPSLFGLNTGTYDHDSAGLGLDTPVAAAMGAQWVHFTAGSLTFSGEAVGFGGLDNAVAQARAYHLGVLVSLGGVPAACSLNPRPAPITSCSPTTAADLRAYSTFLQALMLNLRGRVEYFENWVEPNHASMWAPAPDAAAYARLLVSEYQTVRAVDSRYGLDDRLLFAGIGGSDLGYLGAVLDALGGQPAFDLVGDAPYRFPPTPPATANYALSFPGGGHPALTWAQELTDYENEFTSHGYGQPAMWLTEFGWPGVPAASADGCKDADESLSEQEQDAQSAFAVMKAVGFVEAAFWENERDYERGDINRDPSCFRFYGLLDTDFQPKPPGEAFEELAGRAEQASDPSGPPPTFDSTAAAGAISGAVSDEAPHATAFVPLVGARAILVGSIVNATGGVVRITIATRSGATHSAVFYGGQFKLELTRSGAADLLLDAPLACGAHGCASRAPWAPAAVARRAACGATDTATSRRAAPTPRRRCSGPSGSPRTRARIAVASGMVRVRDFVRHRSVILRAPHSYLARA
jgi:hypothetical protein